ncbi:MFS transporter [Streptomyces sp. NPDC045431]|uniref:MFS transporter n=1 Tax=Streptomyces sp. NPDC045431 TaxID=3155613 RepID=UPI00340C2829
MAKSSLAKTGFFSLWAAESVSLAGSQITLFALPLVAVLTLDAGAWEMGLLTTAGSLSILLFGLSIGVWVDRFERRNLMLLANAVRGLAVLSVPVFFWLDSLSLGLLLLVAFVVGAMSLLFDSAMVPYLPRLVGKDDISRANSWMQGTQSVGDVAGPGVGGVLVQIMSAPVVLVVDAVSYLISSVILGRLPKAAPLKGETDSGDSHGAAVRAGLKMLWGSPILRPLALAAAHFNIFTAVFFALFTLYAVRVLGFSVFLIGVITTVSGVAGLLGSAAAVRLGNRFGLGRVMLISYAVPGLAGLLVPFAENRGAVVGAVMVGTGLFVWTFFVVILLIMGMSLQQQLVPDAYLGRVSSSFRFISWGVEPVGGLVAGVLGTSLLGLRGTLIVASVGIALSALWPLFGPVRTLREVPSGAGYEAVSDPAHSRGTEN